MNHSANFQSNKGGNGMDSTQLAYLHYRRELARCLIKAVGIKGAVEFARRNQWEGIVAHIMAESTP